MEGLKKGILIHNNVAVGAVGDKYFSTCPLGTVLSYAGNIIPRGFLVCDGASYPTADYPDLYAVIGNTYGGDTENFNVPTVQPPALTMVYIIKAFHTNEGVDSGVSDDVINYVNNLNSYSTEETLTSGKWIDGKPIYRKVLTAEVLASDNVPNTRLLVKLNIDATNISQFILIKGIIKVKGINKYVECGGSYYVGDEPQLSTTMTYDGSDILLVLKNGTIGVEWTVNKDLELKAIVEYTKTTD